MHKPWVDILQIHEASFSQNMVNFLPLFLPLYKLSKNISIATKGLIYDCYTERKWTFRIYFVAKAHIGTHYYYSFILETPKIFKNIGENGENDSNHYFLLYPQFFPTPFESHKQAVEMYLYVIYNSMGECNTILRA